MQIEGIELVLVMNFSVLDFFQISPECLKLYRF